ncbi:MAG: hypothetical protein ACR2PL_12550, partial [Dehalococcoidia bacterium]
MRIEGYHLPRRLILPIGLDILRGNQRSFAADCDVMVQAMPKPPLVRGLEQIPVSGPLALVANHYEGPGLWIGWSAAVLTSAIAQVRPDPVPVHWLVLRDMDRGRIRGVKKLAPATSWAFERVARAWSMASLPGPGIPATRAVAVRTLLRLSLPPPTGRGRPVGLFPEGEF